MKKSLFILLAYPLLQFLMGCCEDLPYYNVQGLELRDDYPVRPNVNGGFTPYGYAGGDTLYITDSAIVSLVLDFDVEYHASAGLGLMPNAMATQPCDDNWGWAGMQAELQYLNLFASRDYDASHPAVEPINDYAYASRYGDYYDISGEVFRLDSLFQQPGFEANDPGYTFEVYITERPATPGPIQYRIEMQIGSAGHYIAESRPVVYL